MKIETTTELIASVVVCAVVLAAVMFFILYRWLSRPDKPRWTAYEVCIPGQRGHISMTALSAKEAAVHSLNSVASNKVVTVTVRRAIGTDAPIEVLVRYRCYCQETD